MELGVDISQLNAVSLRHVLDLHEDAPTLAILAQKRVHLADPAARQRALTRLERIFCPIEGDRG